MAARNRLPPHILHLHDPPPPHLHPLEDPRHHLRRPPHPSLLALEDRLASQHRDIQTLLLDNQRLAATHVALKQELNSSRRDLRLVADSAARARADRDAEARGLLDRSAKLEADARAADAMRAELAHVRSDVAKLGAARDELLERLKGVQAEAAKVRSEIGQVAAVKAEIEAMRREIERGRAAVEYEKKAHADNLEQSQAMEKNMISMAREVEKLHSELANAEKRARAAAAAAAAANPGQGYADAYGNNEITYGGSAYPDAYNLHQSQRGSDGGSHYGSVAVSHGPYDIQQSHAQR